MTVGKNPDNRFDVPIGFRRSGVEGGKGVYNKYMNQLLFELKQDHIWGTAAQATLNDATFYTDASGNPLDKNDAAVTIEEDDKILIVHDVAATANMALICGGKKVTLEMSKGVNWDLSTFDLDLGETGDSFSGDLELTGTGTLTIEESNWFQVHHSAMTIVNGTGDIVINNQIAKSDSMPISSTESGAAGTSDELPRSDHKHPALPVVAFRMVNSETAGDIPKLGSGGSDWEKSDTIPDVGTDYYQDEVGTSGVTETSGTFQMPSGYWSVRLYAYSVASAVSQFMSAKIQLSHNGSAATWVTVASCACHHAEAGNQSLSCEVVLRVAGGGYLQIYQAGDTSSYLLGHGDLDTTHIIFEKKADLD